MKYFVLNNDKGRFYLNTFEAKDRDKANEIFEEMFSFGYWLLDLEEFESLKRCVNDN